MLDEMKAKEEEAFKEKQIQEAKSKQELEKLMQERIAQKDSEIVRYKNEIKKERIDNSIMSVASQNNAVSPNQVVALVKDQIRLTDDNRVEILDNNSNVRYNPKGELLSIEEKVKEFLDANPHFRKGSLSGSGSQSAVEGKTVKPFNIQDLDLSKPEDRAKYSEYRKKRDSGAIEINLNK
jgi:5'-3' exonuclease